MRTPQISNKSTNSAKNYKFEQRESKTSVKKNKNKGIKLESEGGG